MKVRIIPDVSTVAQAAVSKDGPQGLLFRDELASYQLVGRVTAYQGY